MHFKAIASAAAISLAMGLGSFAVAQDAAATAWPTMIGNQEVSEADAQRVKTYCEDLQTKANQAEGTENTTADPEPTQDDSAEDSTAAVGAVDTDAITIENCLEGGWLEGEGVTTTTN